MSPGMVSNTELLACSIDNCRKLYDFLCVVDQFCGTSNILKPSLSLIVSTLELHEKHPGLSTADTRGHSANGLAIGCHTARSLGGEE